MAKRKQKAAGALYGLKYGHPQAFRRTIKADKPYQLVFEPGQPLELSEFEIKGLATEIECGLIVPWEQHPNGRASRREAASDDETKTPTSETVAVVSDVSESDDDEAVNYDALLGDE